MLLWLTGSRIRSAGSRPELTVGLSATPMSPMTSSLHQVDDAGHHGIDDILGKFRCIQWHLSIKVGQPLLGSDLVSNMALLVDHLSHSLVFILQTIIE